jgi:predicted O-methyltransferase YrrM
MSTSSSESSPAGSRRDRRRGRRRPARELQFVDEVARPQPPRGGDRVSVPSSSSAQQQQQQPSPEPMRPDDAGEKDASIDDPATEIAADTPTDAGEFNPLRHPVILNTPLLLSVESSWVMQIPLAYLMIDLARPRTFVELGTGHGDSYCAFCQAVAATNSGTRCFAVDRWPAASTLAKLKQHHDAHYADFSTLLQMDFDDAAATQFEDGSIDLLHLDGTLSYDAARHDYETWLPKMSERGVMLFHGTVARSSANSEIWRLWEVLSWQHPSLEFPHGDGLGVAVVGVTPPQAVSQFIRYANAYLAVTQDFFSEMGERILAMQVLLKTSQGLAAQWDVLSKWRQLTAQPGLGRLNISEMFLDPVPVGEIVLRELTAMAEADLEYRQRCEP